MAKHSKTNKQAGFMMNPQMQNDIKAAGNPAARMMVDTKKLNPGQAKMVESIARKQNAMAMTHRSGAYMDGMRDANGRLTVPSIKMSAMYQSNSFLDKVKKAGKTAIQIGKEIGAQLIDLTTGDPGSVKKQPGFSGYYESLENKLNVKDFENEIFDQGRNLVKSGEIYFSLADQFDDAGGIGEDGKKPENYYGIFGGGKRPNYGTNTSSKNRTFGGGR